MPMPIRFGGVPTGVPIPPIEAPNAVISIIASANCADRAGGAALVRVRCATIDSPIGNIIAVVAVLLIHIDSTVQTRAVDDQDARGAGADELRDDSAV